MAQINQTDVHRYCFDNVSFNKHKSWYKLDIEGAFITKNIESTLGRNISRRRNKYAERKTKSLQQICLTDTVKVDVFTDPEISVLSHEYIFGISIHVSVFFVLLVMFYIGLAYVIPIKMYQPIRNDFGEIDVF